MSGRERHGDTANGAATSDAGSVTAGSMAPASGGDDDFLDRLVARSQRRLPLLARRRPGLFEPRDGAAASAETMPEDDATLPPPVPSTVTADDRDGRTAAPPPVALPSPPTLAASIVATVSSPREPQVSRSAAPAAPRTDARSDVRAEPAAAPPALSPPPSLRSAPRADSAAARIAPIASAALSAPAERVDRDGNATASIAPTPSIERIEHLRSETTTRVIEHTVERLRETATAASTDRRDSAPAVASPLRSPQRLPSADGGLGVRVADPVRAAALAAPVPAPTPPPVQVSIGRVEIRARGGAPSAAAPATPKRPRLALDDYLRQRHADPHHGDGR
jgi:hypothetical protein